MKNLSRDDVTRRVADYHEIPGQRPVILDSFLLELSSLIDEEITHQKLVLFPHERHAEAGWAVISAITCWDHNDNKPFESIFLYFFRKALRDLKPRRDHVCIEGLSIEDPNSDPEEIYITKEQIELSKEFLGKHYSPISVDQFMRRFADGQTYSEIAEEYSISTASLIPKLHNMLSRLSKYMKRINNE